jgi:hypothetical protein
MRSDKSQADSIAKSEGQFSALELETIISVPKAAKIRGVSHDTFKRHYGDLIRKLSPRRQGVKLRDILTMK